MYQEERMPDLSFLIQHSLLYGIILSAAMSLFLVGAARINPAIMAGDYPPDIKAKFGAQDERTIRQKRIASLVMMVALAGPIILALAQLAQAGGGQLVFWQAFLSLFIMLFLFNLVDWLVIDWLLFVTIQPRWIILPGTDGMAGYKDYAFHFRGFLIGTVFSVVASAIIAGIAVLVTALL
jgi:uncharacterized membrane protein